MTGNDMSEKAKFLCSTPEKGNAYATLLFYEYRGKEYMITKYDNGCGETLREQHLREQKRIDDCLDNPQPPEPPSGNVERAMADFLAYMDAK